MGKWCLHASLFLGTKDMFKNYKRFDFWHVQMADIWGTKPWKNNCSLIWKLFKFLMTLLAGLFEMRGCWHIGLRWAIVALWATCYKSFEDCYTWNRSAYNKITLVDPTYTSLLTIYIYVYIHETVLKNNISFETVRLYSFADIQVKAYNFALYKVKPAFYVFGSHFFFFLVIICLIWF